MYENDFPKENSKTILKKIKKENIFQKRAKMKIYSVFILRARFMMQVFQKIKIFSSIAYDSVWTLSLAPQEIIEILS